MMNEEYKKMMKKLLEDSDKIRKLNKELMKELAALEDEARIVHIAELVANGYYK